MCSLLVCDRLRLSTIEPPTFFCNIASAFVVFERNTIQLRIDPKALNLFVESGGIDTQQSSRFSLTARRFRQSRANKVDFKLPQFFYKITGCRPERPLNRKGFD